MLQLCFPVDNKVQTMFTPILIPNKNSHELVSDVNPMSKKLFHVFGLFYVWTKKNFEK